MHKTNNIPNKTLEALDFKNECFIILVKFENLLQYKTLRSVQFTFHPTDASHL